MPDETLTEQLALSHNALRFEQIPSDVVDAAKLHIIDSLGCLFAGSRLEPGRLAYDFADATSGTATHSTTTLLGTNRRVSCVDAVQAMSVAAHCGEMDDIHTGAGTCIGAMIIPALLAKRQSSVMRPSRGLDSASTRRSFSPAAGGRVRFAVPSASPLPARNFLTGCQRRPPTPWAL